MLIRETSATDLDSLLRIHRAAFGQDVEADLVQDILADPTARPVLSLLAVEDGRPLGHILFSRARSIPARSGTGMALLAPLAVVPEAQGQGIGSELVKTGLQRLSDAGTALVFVLGHPNYYGRFAFEPATRQGLKAPFPLPEAYAEAWMVKTLRPDPRGALRGNIVCCDALNRPALWRE